MTDNIKIRGHHLLCLLCYEGRGYTPAFTENFNQIAARLNAGAPAILVTGLDDICAALHCGDNGDYKDHAHCHKETAAARDIAAIKTINAALNTTLQTGDTIPISEDYIKTLRQSYAQETLQTACQNCEWLPTCKAIAADGFKRAKLFPPK